jgi:hypothetical protein
VQVGILILGGCFIDGGEGGGFGGYERLMHDCWEGGTGMVVGEAWNGSWWGKIDQNKGVCLLEMGFYLLKMGFYRLKMEFTY